MAVSAIGSGFQNYAVVSITENTRNQTYTSSELTRHLCNVQISM